MHDDLLRYSATSNYTTRGVNRTRNGDVYSRGREREERLSRARPRAYVFGLYLSRVIGRLARFLTDTILVPPYSPRDETRDGTRETLSTLTRRTHVTSSVLPLYLTLRWPCRIRAFLNCTNICRFPQSSFQRPLRESQSTIFLASTLTRRRDAIHSLSLEKSRATPYEPHPIFYFTTTATLSVLRFYDATTFSSDERR